jgi:cytochrome c-type biogenesis protein CcmH
LVVVVGTALVVGASHRSYPVTDAQRAAAIDAQLRCPSCEGISVADSSASTAVAIRRVVAQRVQAGQSDVQIEAFLTGKYGPGILLRPPVRGGTALVWVLPPAAAGAALVGLAGAFWRRRRVVPVGVTTEDRLLVERALAQRARHDGVPGAIRSDDGAPRGPSHPHRARGAEP